MKAIFKLKETIATIIADKEEYIEVAEQSIRLSRAELESYIRKDPFFRITLEPYACKAGGPEIVERMSKASFLAGVGPMAAVAGTIAALAVEAMVKKGATHAIVDNGGDIALINDREVLVGIHAGSSSLGLGFRLEPSDEILGICTSSGTVGPSLSFGYADAATVISKDVALADAVATALGNEIKEGKTEEIKKALEKIKRKEIEGALVIKGKNIGFFGNLPELIRAKIKPEIITKG